MTDTKDAIAPRKFMERKVSFRNIEMSYPSFILACIGIAFGSIMALFAFLMGLKYGFAYFVSMMVSALFTTAAFFLVAYVIHCILYGKCMVLAWIFFLWYIIYAAIIGIMALFSAYTVFTMVSKPSSVETYRAPPPSKPVRRLVRSNRRR